MFGNDKRRKKNGTDDDQNVNTQTATGADEPTEMPTDGKQTTPTDDPFAWMKEFDFPADELATRGEPIGHIRFVAFQPADESKIKLMTNIDVNETFANAMVQHLLDNDDSFDFFKHVVEKAERVRKIRKMDIGEIIGSLFGMERPGPFSPGGQSFGEMDELAELFGRPKRRSRNPLESLLERLGERGGRPKIGIEARVLEIKRKPGQSVDDAIRDAIKNDMTDGENPISSLADLMRTITGGEGCDCQRCTELRERKKRESETGTDDKTE